MKLVLVVAAAGAGMLAVGGVAQFFAASTDAAGALRANLAIAYAVLATGLLVLFCAAHAVLSRLDMLLAPDQAPDRAEDLAIPPVIPAVASNPYQSLTQYYFANNGRD